MSRSASRRELAKTMVERWEEMTSRIRFSTCGQIDGARAGFSSSSETGPGADEAPRSVMSSTGTTMSRSQRFSDGGATMSTSYGPPR